jgi:hypothetical protein
MLDEDSLEKAAISAQLAWKTSFPGFTSGHDLRTSTNALLVEFFGNVKNASEHEWQNAGRRIIDKTFISMMMHVHSLTAIKSVTPERISASLDNFLQKEVAKYWREISLNQFTNLDLALNWHKQLSITVIGSNPADSFTSYLMFYMLPSFPVIPISKGSLISLDIPLDTPISLIHEMVYKNFDDFKARYANSEKLCAPPEPIFGTDREMSMINELLLNTDWWQRNLFHHYLIEGTKQHPNYDHSWFGCNDEGGISRQ